MEFKVTNSYTSEYNEKTEVVLCGRNENMEHRRIHVTDVTPFFFAPTDVVKEKESRLIRQNNVKEIDHDPETTGWKGEDLSKIILYDSCSHWDMKDVAENNFHIDEQFDADVFMSNQLRIEQGIHSGVRVDCEDNEIGYKTKVTADEIEPVEIKEFRTRISYIDIEVDDRGEFVKDGSRPIISVVAQDSYTEEKVGFFWTGEGRQIHDCFPSGRPSKLDRLEWATTEEDMIQKFMDYLEEHDQDLWTGWNFEDFDAPYILNRIDEYDGLNKQDLSRNGYCKTNKNNKALVGGRVMYDLQNAWERTKYKEPDSKALDNVAKKELGRQKIEHPGKGYQEMWEEDPELLMNYNAVDVVLCKELNEELGTLSFWRTIGDVVGVDWEDTRSNSDYIEMFCRRKLFEKDLVGPVTNYSRPEADYEGGFVFEPHYGREQNVMGLDLASLYPYSMEMGNLSPEMKLTDKEDIDTLKRAGIPVCEPPIEDRTVAFRLDEDGIFKELISDAIGLKAEAKKKKNEKGLDPEIKSKREEEYMAKKTVTNSIYGVLGWEPFFLYDKDCAEATTLLGQSVTKRTAQYVEEETDAEVVYGDTDSNYISFPNDMKSEDVIKRGLEICNILNDEVYPNFAQEFGIPGEMNRWDIEPEVLMDTFFQSGAKKFYAYKAIWDEGEWLEDPEYTVKGYGFKKSSSSTLTQETGYELMEAILDWEDESVISNIIAEAADGIDPLDPDWEKIGMPQGLGKEIHIDCECEECYNWSKTRHTPKGAHPRGAYFMNLLAGRSELEKGTKPKRVYLEPTMTVGEGEQLEKVDVIAYENIEDVPDDVIEGMKVDTPAMTEKLIKNPFEDILDAVDIDVDAAIRGQTQTGFEAFM